MHQETTMKSKLIFSWAQFIDSFRPASSVMMLQGVLCLLFCESDQLIAWGRGSVLIGVLFYAVWAAAKLLSKNNDRNMDGARF